MDKRKFTGEAIAYALGRAMEGAAAFIVLPFAGRILGPANYGVADIITATNALLYLLIGLNFTHALTRYFYDTDNVVLASTHAAMIIANSLVVVTVGLAAIYIFRGELTHDAAWVAALLVIPLHVATEHLATIFRLRHEPLRYLAVVSVAMGLWVLTTPFMLVVLQSGIKSLFIGKIVGFAFGILVAGTAFHRIYRLRFNTELFRKSLRFALPMFPATVAAWGLIQVPRYMLGLGASVEEVGYYGVAFRFSFVLTMIGSAGLMTWFPFAMGIKDQEDAPGILGRGILVFAAINVSVAIAIAAFAHEEVLLIIGTEFRTSGNLIGVMIASTVFYNLSMMLFVQISISEKTYWQSIGNAIGFFTMFGVNVALVPYWKSFGAAVGLFAGQSIAALVMLIAAQRLFPIRLDIVRIGILLLLLGGAAAGGWWIEAAVTARWVAITWKTLLVLIAWTGCFVVLGREQVHFGMDMLRTAMKRSDSA